MKKIFSLFFATLIASNIFGQINFGKLGTDVLVDNSIKDGVSIIESEYQLRNKKDGVLYGRGGKNVYGSVYHVGVNTPMGVIAMDNILTPWSSDPDFDKYRSNDSYEPVLKEVKVYSKGKSDSVSCIEYPLESGIICNSDSTLFLLRNLNLTNNFDVQTESDVTDTWIIWFIAGNESNLHGFENLEFNTLYQKQDKDINGTYVKTPLGKNILIGGIVVTPNIIGIGKIEFKLVGLINKKNNNWEIMSIPKDFFSYSDQSSSEPKKSEIDNPLEEEELTPINSESKKPQKTKNKKK